MRRMARYVMSVTMPAHDGIPGANDTKIDAFLDEFGANAHPIIRLGFYASVFIFIFSPLFTVKLPVPIFILSKAKRDLHIKRYSESPNMIFSQLWMLQKMIVGLCWGMDESVRAYYNYEPLLGDPGTFQTGEPEIMSESFKVASEEYEELNKSEAKS